MEQPVNTQAPRPNPFVFPSDTTFRFLLLIVMVLSVSAFLFDSLFFTFNAQRVLDTFERCRAEASAMYSPDSNEYFVTFSQCRAPLAQIQAAWTGVGMVLLLFVAIVIYWLIPAWKIWRNRLQLLRVEDAPELIAYLAGLGRECGLAQMPVFMCNALNGACSGLAFGRLGRYYVVLNGGLVKQFYKDRAAFRAVMLHELAHIRNADINKTYFSRAIWNAFLVVGILPYGITSFFPPAGNAPTDISITIMVGFRFLALAILVFSIYKAVLRAREIYADLRASLHDGSEGALDRVLAKLQRPSARTWTWFLHAHPDPEERRRTLADTSSLFRMGFWEIFGTGIAAAIAFESMFVLLSTLTTGVQEILWGLTLVHAASLGASVIFMPLVGGVVVAAVSREHFVAMVRGINPHGANQLAVGLTAGAAIGLLLAPQRALTIEPAFSFSLLVFRLLWALLLLVWLWLLLQWLGSVASVWLGAALRLRSPRSIIIAMTLIAGLLLSILIGHLFPIYHLGSELVDQSGLLLLFGVLSSFFVSARDPLTVLAFIGLWAFPLASIYWYKATPFADAPTWAFLDPQTQSVMLPVPIRLSIKPAVLIGLAGGLAWCAMVFGASIIARLAWPGFAPADPDQASWILSGLIVTSILAQSALAIVAALWAKQLHVAHGLLAAFVSGCIMMAFTILLKLFLIGGTVGPDTIWISFSSFIGMGTLVVFPIVTTVSTAFEWMRRARLARARLVSIS